MIGHDYRRSATTLHKSYWRGAVENDKCRQKFFSLSSVKPIEAQNLGTLVGNLNTGFGNKLHYLHKIYIEVFLLLRIFSVTLSGLNLSSAEGWSTRSHQYVISVTPLLLRILLPKQYFCRCNIDHETLNSLKKGLWIALSNTNLLTIK